MIERQRHSASPAEQREDSKDRLPVLPHIESRSIRRTIRRAHLRQIVPLADTTIYEMEQRGEFPRRFHLTPRCVVWDLAEVEAWIERRRLASDASQMKRAPIPDVRQRKTRPVRQ
jgi:prophage regulatory protein